MGLDEAGVEHLKLLQELARLKNASDNPELYTQVIQGVMLMDQNYDGEAFVKEYCTDKGVNVRPDGIWICGRLVKNQKVLFNKIYKEFQRAKERFKVKKSLSREDIALEFEEVLEDDWNARYKALQEYLQPEGDHETFDKILSQIVRALCGHAIKEDSKDWRLYKGFIAHWVWQVMQKLHYGPKSILGGGNESVLLLVSPTQKSGKSTTIRHLIKPFEGFVWRSDLGRLADNFSYANLGYNFIAWFDDLEKDSSINMGKFKKLVTDEEVHYRAIYTQTEMRVPKLATFVGTSNKSARELMPDATGLRRFHQIFVNNASVDTGRGIDLQSILDIDPRQLYVNVPMGNQTPLWDYITPTEMFEYEESIKPLHIVQLWAKEQGFEPVSAEEGYFQYTKELYDQFKVWALETGYNPKYISNRPSFGRKLSELGFRNGRKPEGRGYWIGEEK